MTLLVLLSSKHRMFDALRHMKSRPSDGKKGWRHGNVVGDLSKKRHIFDSLRHLKHRSFNVLKGQSHDTTVERFRRSVGKAMPVGRFNKTNLKDFT